MLLLKQIYHIAIIEIENAEKRLQATFRLRSLTVINSFIKYDLFVKFKKIVVGSFI